MTLPDSLCGWVFTDGKAGHVNQSMGLVDALSDLLPIEHHHVPPCHPVIAGISILTGLLPRPWRVLPAPDLVIGAGRKTHLSLLAAKRVYRSARTVVLMRPGYSARLFDLCLIPLHDNPPVSENIIATQGALNRIRHTSNHGAHSGLILIGGPSKHHGWSDQQMIEQIVRIVFAEPKVDWTLTTSRRTPTSFLEKLSAVGNWQPTIGNPEPKTEDREPSAENPLPITIVPSRDTPPGWIAEQLARCGIVWVSEDSMSMVYEALTAGVSVGILAVPRKRESRITTAIDALGDQGLLTHYERWLATGEMPKPSVLAETQRCAELIYERWFAERPTRRA